MFIYVYSELWNQNFDLFIYKNKYSGIYHTYKNTGLLSDLIMTFYV